MIAVDSGNSPLSKMERPLNILVSTTHGFNLGDDLIRHGCQFLVEEVLGRWHNWFQWNRNPDLDRRNNFATNAISSKRLASGVVWDLVVFAGTPEWCGPRVSALTEFLLTKSVNTPVIFLGIGSAAAHEKADSRTAELMRQARTLVVTRNPSLQRQLQSQNISVEPLPCPALFSADQLGISLQSQRRYNLLTFQTYRDAIYQEVPEQRLLNCLQAAQQSGWQLVAHYVAEALEVLRRGLSVRYAGTSLELLQVYSTGRAVASTRLHGGIAALSCCVPAVLIGPDEHRLSNAALMFGEHLPVMTTHDATTSIEQWTAEELKRRTKVLSKFKDETMNRYTKVLRVFLTKNKLLPQKVDRQFQD
jgi:hypothetical protein